MAPRRTRSTHAWTNDLPSQASLKNEGRPSVCDVIHEVYRKKILLQILQNVLIPVFLLIFPAISAFFFSIETLLFYLKGHYRHDQSRLTTGHGIGVLV